MRRGGFCNLPRHKSAKAEAILKQHGACSLFLPPYSLDLDPIKIALRRTQGLSQAHRRANHRRVLESHPRHLPPLLRAGVLRTPARCPIKRSPLWVRGGHSCRVHGEQVSLRYQAEFCDTLRADNDCCRSFAQSAAIHVRNLWFAMRRLRPMKLRRVEGVQAEVTGVSLHSQAVTHPVSLICYPSSRLLSAKSSL